MTKLLSTGQYRIALQFCAAGGLAALMSGCSADSTRFGDPFTNPFATSAVETTSSTKLAAAGDVIPAGRTPPVTSRALAPRAVASATPRSPAMVASRSSISNETTGSIDPGPARVASGSSFGGWSSRGGTPIQVADGETADVLSKRYGVPTAALLQTNGLHSASELRPGSQIVIPVYGAVAASASPARVAVAAPVAPVTPRVVEKVAVVPAHAARERVVAERPQPRKAVTTVVVTETKAPAKTVVATRTEPLAKVRARLAPTEPVTRVASAPAKVTTTTSVKVVAAPSRATSVRTVVATAKAAPVQQVTKVVLAKASPVQQVVVKTVPAKAVPVQQVATKVVPVKAAPVKTAAVAPPGKTEKVATAEPAKPVVTDPTPTASVAPAAPVTTAAADGGPEFRWPARGRIIQGFKSGAGGNDGINIAVPEGTAVKAAEGSVVAYAGSDLKGYGNLVLIRHPNGFVSAYANNGELDVKRGDTVKRGQQIAKSGQSGNVSSPQLHFELRKGSTPVDPTQFLAGL